jgi:hypothetical protein
LPLPFVYDLFGLKSGKPNIADIASVQSTTIAAHLFAQLGVSEEVPFTGQIAGVLLEEGVRTHFAQVLPSLAPDRTWIVERRLLITAYEQYEHLARLDALVANDQTNTLSTEIGRDYMVRPDVTVGIERPGHIHPQLHAAISCKFTIRSDRVQNIRHEGVILTRHRRGRQPHIVTVTSEPLPTRLAAIARGTGEVDAVYHVCLPELITAVNDVGIADQQNALAEIIGQNRLFDIGVLANELVV